MKSATVRFRFEFVTNAPEILEDNVLYVSLPYSTTLHLCPCGCKSEVANKISRSRYTLSFDGESVSLTPSIRNSGIPCKSHYFITRNEIVWAYDWPIEKFDDTKKKSAKRKKKFWLFG